MVNIKIDALENYIRSTLEKCGLNEHNTAAATDVFMRATYRGVGHHDIYEFTPRLDKLMKGTAVPNPEYTPISSFGAMESWDAGNGLGEVVCTYGMDRAMKLADEHGMGLCALRNTNHFLAAAPYVERAAEKGYIALILSKGGVSMGAADRQGSCMSALPMGFAYETGEDSLVMLDCCMAYASMGLLRDMDKKGQQVKPWWGLDKDGNPTTQPLDLLAGTRFPIGGHKGFGLAMLGEVLTAVLSMGCILDEKETDDGLTNWSSHTAIAIKADALMDMDTFRKRSGALSERTTALSPGLHIPGQGSAGAKSTFVEQGYFPLEEELIETLNHFADKLGAATL